MNHTVAFDFIYDWKRLSKLLKQENISQVDILRLVIDGKEGGWEGLKMLPYTALFAQVKNKRGNVPFLPSIYPFLVLVPQNKHSTINL